jgi:ribosomal protein S12 methylthiotransferase accessory factor
MAAFVENLSPALDGSLNADGLVARLADYSRQSVMALLQALVSHGLVEEVDDRSPRRWLGQQAFFGRFAAESENQASQSAEILAAARVLVVGLEPWGAAAAEALAAAGVGTLHVLDDRLVSVDDAVLVPGWDERWVGRSRCSALAEALSRSAPWTELGRGSVDIDQEGHLVVPTGTWDLALGGTTADDIVVLLGLARAAHKRGIRSLTTYLRGLEAVVGPAVVPGATACWNCAEQRQLAAADDPPAAHEVHRSLLAGQPGHRTPMYPVPAASLLGGLAALEAIKLLTAYTGARIVGRILVQHLVSLETSHHTVIRLPWCEVCGGEAARLTPPEVPTGWSGPGPGGDKLQDAADPGEVREALSGWVDPKTGVIRGLYLAHPNARDPELPLTASAVLAQYHHLGGDPEIGSGKGLTATEALLGAAGEAIERYSAARYRNSDLHRAALYELNADHLDPRRLCLYDLEQYETPEFPYAPFDPEQMIPWTNGWRIPSGEKVLLPALPVYFNLHAPGPEYFCQVTSNGLAAGATLPSAALSATLELIERDAFMITWLTKRPGRRLKPDATLSPQIHEVIRQLEERGADANLLQLNAGIDVPVVACVCLGDGIKWPSLTVALAAGRDLPNAAARAILEQGHVGPYIQRMFHDGDDHIPDEPDQVKTMLDHALFYAPPGRRSLADFLFASPDPSVAIGELTQSPVKSVEECGTRLAAVGIDLAIADVTAPDVRHSPFRVARALGTDMQPIHFGYGLERRANPRLEAASGANLNRLPHPLA